MVSRPSVSQMKSAYEQTGNFTEASRLLKQSGLIASRDTIRRNLLHAADHGFDGSTPKPLPVGQRLKGMSILYKTDESGRASQVAQWVKTTAEDMHLDDVEAAIRRAFESYKGLATLVPTQGHFDTELLTMYGIADLHLGMYSYAKETGANYDIKIAEQLLKSTLSRLILSSPKSEVGVILNMGDYFHTDSSQNRTPRSGHALDVDTRQAKILPLGVRMMIWAVEFAKQHHKRVVVRCLPGNHDPETALMLAVALSIFFEKDDRVEVDMDPSLLWFYQHGATMLAATHGHTIKHNQLAHIMASRQPVMWGNTVFRYGFTGHIHHRTQVISEMDGAEIQSLQTIAAKDAYAASGPWQSNRAMEAITFHKEEGEVERHKVNIKYSSMVESN